MRGQKDSRQDAEYTRGERLNDEALPQLWNLAEVLIYSIHLE
jgi:hypothetical protein